MARCFERLGKVVESFVSDAYPGASIAIAYRGQVVFMGDYGYLQLTPAKRPIRPNALFDLASLTKPLATSIILMRLVEDGLIHLNQRVSDILPEFSKTESGYNMVKDSVRLWMLLSHSSGLPPWLPLYKASKSRNDVIEGALKAQLTYYPGSTVVYSDLNYIILTAVAERVSGERMDELFSGYVVEPLGLERSLYNPLGKFTIDEIAATEVIGSEPLVGIVHDENARAMDGVSGHAGLFSTSLEASKIALDLLNAVKGRDSRLLSRATVESMWRPWACGDTCYGLGWLVYRRGVTSSGGDLLSDSSFGHTGFTGTSIWVDVERDLVIVLLTNRVHPTRENRRIDYARPIIHNVAVSEVHRCLRGIG